jgi:hypothetical protein
MKICGSSWLSLFGNGGGLGCFFWNPIVSSTEFLVCNHIGEVWTRWCDVYIKNLHCVDHVKMIQMY